MNFSLLLHEKRYRLELLIRLGFTAWEVKLRSFCQDLSRRLTVTTNNINQSCPRSLFECCRDIPSVIFTVLNGSKATNILFFRYHGAFSQLNEDHVYM